MVHRAPGGLERRSAALNRVLVGLGVAAGVLVVYGLYFLVAYSTAQP
jgi:hypothetical protein